MKPKFPPAFCYGLMIGLVAALAVIASTTGASSGPFGPDLNGDGTVNLQDVKLFIAAWRQVDSESTARPSAIDPDNNGTLDRCDAELLLRAMLGHNLVGRAVYQTGWPPETHSFPIGSFVLHDTKGLAVGIASPDAAGRFGFYGLPEGTYILTADEATWQGTQWRMKQSSFSATLHGSAGGITDLGKVVMEPLPPPPAD